MGNELSPTLPEDWVTIDMVNRFTFCPRLFHLMYVEGRWEENHFTLEGKAIHRRVDRIDQILPEFGSDSENPKAEPEGDPPPEIARSVSLAAADPAFCAKFIIPLIHAKVSNQRALILRNGSGPEKETATRELATHLRTLDPVAATIDARAFQRSSSHDEIDFLRGWEGYAAASYFAAFSGMLKTGELDFDFNTRNRRPPKDPVNALLSFTYALLVKECLVALWGEGLDPWWGLYHRPRHGRPALALDFMEPFRPVLADSAVITCINTGMVKPKDFITNRNGCAMQPAAKKAILRAFTGVIFIGVFAGGF